MSGFNLLNPCFYVLKKCIMTVSLLDIQFALCKYMYSLQVGLNILH